MLFSKSVPEEVLESPNTKAFVSIFDQLQVRKRTIIAESLRASNPVLCNNVRWLFKYLEDFGITGLSEFLPIVCIQQFALNINRIYKLRGSLTGTHLLLDTLTLGESLVEMEPPDETKYVKPDSFTEGFITSSSDTEDVFYLLDRNDPYAPDVFNVSLRSRIFNDVGEGTQEYNDIIRCIKNLMGDFIGFHKNCTINITTEGIENYIYPEYLSDYFKN